MKNYDQLIFIGWNTMTDENMDKLTEYVRLGGRLLLSAAHLNYSAKRKGEYIPPASEKLDALCGVKFTGQTIRTNRGLKFVDSVDPTLLYPATKSLVCDPLYSAGYVNYLDIETTGANVLAVTSDSFRSAGESNAAVVENRVGGGLVTLVLSEYYPGNPALYPLYTDLVREAVTRSARECEIKVIAPDKLRYTVYEGNKMYLLNTDYDLPISAKIIYNGKETVLTLDSLELKTIQL